MVLRDMDEVKMIEFFAPYIPGVQFLFLPALAAWKIAGRERRTRIQRHACCVQRNAYLEVKACYCELQKAKLLRSCQFIHWSSLVNSQCF